MFSIMVSIYMPNYPVMYSLSERERAAVNIQGTVFTLAGLKIVPTIKNLMCRYLLYNVRCDAVENYMFPLRFTTGVSGWIVICGSQEMHVFTIFLKVQDITT